jgi:hypothetical protein
MIEPKGSSMRLFFVSLTRFLLVLVLIGIGCSTVSPDECWPNTSGGLGGSEPIPIGAGVGATTGGDLLEPPREPLDNGAAQENPCVKPNDDTTPPQDDAPVEASLKGSTCSKRCLAQGIGCVPLAVHPYKVDGGIGKLFSCNDLPVGFMCGYHYLNGDDCYYPFAGLPFPKVCSYSGND